MSTDTPDAPVPGAPSSETPSYGEPTSPRSPLPPTPDQAAPAPVSATGASATAPDGVRAQQGEWLTTAGGTPLAQTDHSLRAGRRGPVLLQDHHLREKTMHFDHERIPERVVHARGAAAHGTFRSYGAADGLTSAAFLAEGVETPVFVRFSTVLGSRGSADTVRDTRGFATKFYTSEGVFDLVGNNIPVFFIQDAIKFADVIHAGKPHPDREIPQAQSAHDTFWDFVSLHTEAQHHAIWNMSDRGIPRSYRTMEGFGVHTFRLVADDGSTRLVKFHWKPRAGVHSLVWEEAQLLAGLDPDFHRRDLADAIESGAFPSWQLGVQVMPDTPDQTFEGIDLLDPTKLVPEELAPVHLLGEMTLERNPTNYFAETEQVAFHVGHLVRGIDVTDDPLMAGRMFSYLDTQLTRLGGPNFEQIPINRPRCPVNDLLRDGHHQDAVHTGVAPYHPNSLDGGNPFPTPAERAFVETPAPVAAGEKVRGPHTSVDDHFSQTRMFWLSLTPVERRHVVDAYAFELGKCYEQVVKERQLACLARVDEELCRAVAVRLGLGRPDGEVAADVAPSPSLSQLGLRWPVAGRVVGVVVDVTIPLAPVLALRAALQAQGVRTLVIGPRGGVLVGTDGTELMTQRSLDTTRSVELDAVVVGAAPPPRPDLVPVEGAGLDPRLDLLLEEAWRHGKAIVGWGAGAAVLEPYDAQPGVLVTDSASDVAGPLLERLEQHRVWERLHPTG
ncbi:catalase [Lapillicoccus jejuensis]|uniref:Catalase n=1 Tax=Lapillicoccus jejuensis TaxID=402171 RepID=A0A542DXL1_9MICO|nr:catalase [Lapillicoccus jejuensis]TQJ07818.1 catalase [Lapillicoccus jejuensis]